MGESLYTNYLKYPVTLVGCGGIGSNVLPILAKAGVERLTLFDDDIVEPVNLQAQNFAAEDLGKWKVSVLGREALRFNPDIYLTVRHERVTEATFLDGIVISAVDSMKSRKAIFEAASGSHALLLIDGRLSRGFSEFFDLYVIDLKKNDARTRYEAWLFSDEEAHHAPRPTVMSGHTPHILSGVIGSVLLRWVRGEGHPWKVTYNGAGLHLESYPAT